MTEYNEGLFDGMVGTFTLGHIDADTFWELLHDQHFTDDEANVLNIHLTDFVDDEKKVALFIACPNKFAVSNFLETFETEFEDYMEELEESMNA